MPCAPPYNILLPPPSALRESCICSNHPIPTPTIATLELLPASHLSPSMCTCTCTHYVSLPDVAHSVGMKQEDSGGPGKTASGITGFKKSKIEPEARYLLCHCLARCLPSYCCTGAYWRILENTAPYWCMCSAAVGSTTRLPDSLEHPEPELTLPGCNC